MGQKGTIQMVRNVLQGKLLNPIRRSKSSAPVKSTKLLPVCLRVDPPPKKKNGTASRSPSPPKSKSSSPLSHLEVNQNQGSQARKDTTTDSKEVKTKRNEEKVIRVVKRQKSNDQVAENKTASQNQVATNLALEVSEPNEGMERPIAEAEDPHAVEVRKPKETTQETTASRGGSEGHKRTFLVEEAALLIQSVYRGHSVRRWEPLKKLKQIAQVRERLTEIRGRIDALESSSDLRKDSKQCVVIGEMIMSLLLKLDTVQGLHPTLRDIRKSLARELVALQERIDSIKVDKEMVEDQHIISPTLGSGDVGSIKEQEPEQLDGNKETLKTRDLENGDSSVAMDDVQEVKLGCESSEGQKSISSCDSEPESGYATGVKHEEVIAVEASPEEKWKSMEMEAIADSCGEETDPTLVNCKEVKCDDYPAAPDENDEQASIHAEEMEECSTENSTPPSHAVSCPTSSKEITEVDLPLESLSGIPNVKEDHLCENPGRKECEIVYRDGLEVGVLADAAYKQGPMSDADKERRIDMTSESVSVDGSEIHVDGQPQNVYKSLKVSESKEAPNFEVEQQPKEETNVRCLIDQAKDQVEGEAENPSESPKSAASEEVEHQSELSEAVDENLHSVALQSGGMSLTGPELQELKSPDESCGGEVSCDQDIELNPTAEKENIGITYEEEKRVVSEDRNVAVEKAEEVKEPEETQEAGQDEMESTVANDKPHLNLSRAAATERNMVAPPNAGDADDDNKEGDLSPLSSSIASQAFVDEQKLAEENAKLREMVEKLMEAGKEQLTAISSLTDKVKDLEKKLARRKRPMRARRCRTAISPPSRSGASIVSNKGAASLVM